MDMSHGFFLVKFDLEEDRTMAIEGGTLDIFYHYVLVCPWCLEFMASKATVDKTLVWVRIPCLNLLFQHESFIMAVTAMVRRPIIADMNTLKMSGGSSRGCVSKSILMNQLQVRCGWGRHGIRLSVKALISYVRAVVVMGMQAEIAPSEQGQDWKMMLHQRCQRCKGIAFNILHRP